MAVERNSLLDRQKLLKPCSPWATALIQMPSS